MAQMKGTFVVSDDTHDSMALGAVVLAFLVAFMGFMIGIAFIALVGFDVFMAVIVFMALMAFVAFVFIAFIAFVFIAFVFIVTIARDQFGPLQAGQQPGRNTTLGPLESASAHDPK